MCADALATSTLRADGWLSLDEAARRSGRRNGHLSRRCPDGWTAEAAADKDPFLDYVERLYLTPRKLKLTVCHEIASLQAAERGWVVRSYKACQRHLEAIPKGVVLRKRFGDEAYTNEGEPFLERDYSCLRSNEIWDSDHHQFDVVVRVGDRLVRPWL